MTNPPPASSIDLRCCCGATMFVECAADPYDHVVSLGKSFIATHQKCAGFDYSVAPPKPVNLKSLAAYDVAILRAAREIIERENAQPLAEPASV